MKSDQGGAAQFVPETTDLDRLRDAATACQGCGLYRDATQTVFGSGATEARVCLVGEQPGNQEDRAGAPFVGPAGRLLDKALVRAGIDRDGVYLTNTVKHFKFTRAERGKQRLHKKPSGSEITACRPWLLAELRTLRPELVVLLGATAAKAVLGPAFALTRQRGQVLELGDDLVGQLGDPVPLAMATAHPSAVLRATDRDQALDALVADLEVAAKHYR